MAISETLSHAAHGVAPHENDEGTVTKAIEHYTSQVPSGTCLKPGFVAARSAGR